MRLTVEMLKYIEGYLNPLREREISLRGYKIPMIENLGILKDQFDVVDISDNSIQILDNFPLMPRLIGLLCHNNKIASFATDLGSYIPNLENLVLTNNRLNTLAQLDGIESLTKLERLVLVGNDVTKEKGYRLFVIARLPKLRHLDYRKVAQSERKEAKRIFGDTVAKGAKAASERAAKKAKLEKGKETNGSVDDGSVAMTEEQRNAIAEAIKGATHMEEIDRLEAMLKSGRIPKSKTVKEMITGKPTTTKMETD